jgi:hypothetical protein
MALWWNGTQMTTVSRIGAEGVQGGGSPFGCRVFVVRPFALFASLAVNIPGKERRSLVPAASTGEHSRLIVAASSCAETALGDFPVRCIAEYGFRKQHA